MKKFCILTVSIFLFVCTVNSPIMAYGPASIPDSGWVDSVFNSLTPDQRIAQLFIIRAFSDKDSVYRDSLINIIRKWNPGGVCFFKGGVKRQAILTNAIQKISQTPLLISIDAEYGLGMRIDSTFSYPRALTLGALPDDSLIEEVGDSDRERLQKDGNSN